MFSINKIVRDLSICGIELRDFTKRVYTSQHNMFIINSSVYIIANSSVQYIVHRELCDVYNKAFLSRSHVTL